MAPEVGLKAAAADKGNPLGRRENFVQVACFNARRRPLQHGVDVGSGDAREQGVEFEGSAGCRHIPGAVVGEDYRMSGMSGER